MNNVFFPLKSISRFVFVTFRIVTDFKLSSRCECCILPLGDSPGVWILCTDVSEHCFIFPVSEFSYADVTEHCSIFPASEFYMRTFRNTVPSSRDLDFICGRFGTLLHLPGIWSLYVNVSGHCSIFPASELYMRTFRNTVTSSRHLNVMYRRFGTLFHLSGIWILCTDVSEHCSIFPASEFYMRTFRKTVSSSRRLTFMYRRFGTLFYFPGFWILYADVSEHCSIFPVSEVYMRTFRNTLSSSRPLNFICGRFRTLCSIFIGRLNKKNRPMKMEQTEFSETSARKIQTRGNHPKEGIQQFELCFLCGKVKCTLVQALRLRTGRTAHWRSRVIALLFHDQRH